MTDSESHQNQQDQSPLDQLGLSDNAWLALFSENELHILRERSKEDPPTHADLCKVLKLHMVTLSKLEQLAVRKLQKHLTCTNSRFRVSLEYRTSWSKIRGYKGSRKYLAVHDDLGPNACTEPSPSTGPSEFVEAAVNVHVPLHPAKVAIDALRLEELMETQPIGVDIGPVAASMTSMISGVVNVLTCVRDLAMVVATKWDESIERSQRIERKLDQLLSTKG